MKRVWMSLLLCGMAATAAAAPLAASVQFDGTRVLKGTVEGRSGGSVVFRPRGDAPVGLTESRLVKIIFEMDDLRDLTDSFESKAYDKVADAGKVLEPALVYIGLPGNLPEYVMQWLIASYWNGDYDRVAELAEKLEGIENETIPGQVDFYGRLARMEQGKFGEMESFLESSEADSVFPKDSAARLYIEARILQNEGQTLEALRTISRVIALYNRDADWTPTADLLCLDLYFKLEMPESAEAVLADIQMFYNSQFIQDKATAIADKQN